MRESIIKFGIDFFRRCNMTKVLMMCMYIVLAAAGGTQDSHRSWANQDIGEVTAPGSATYNERAMIWVVRGDGINFVGRSDSFQYVYQRLRGDGSIIARIESIDNTDPRAKCGVMIRESLNPGSRFAAVFATPDKGAIFQIRVDKNGRTSAVPFVTRAQKDLEAPVWVKLERKGNQLSAYYASEKKDPVWIAMAERPQVIAMSPTVRVGLAVTSHAPGLLCEAIFSNVAVSGIEGGITDAEILADPGQALREAYRDLERLGNWGENAHTIKQHGNLIASSLLDIARVREFSGEPVDKVLPLYYRVTETVPDSPFSVDALIRIAVLDGEKGLEYAEKHRGQRQIPRRCGERLQH
jgi:hypothetical protein